MITLSQLRTYLDDTLQFDKKLDVSKIDPYMSNGLMVRGRGEIKKVGFGVSASLSLFQKAVDTNCDAIIVHHSFNFPSVNVYDSLFQGRIEYLVEHKISLFGYHFLLDAHPEFGHNVQMLKCIGATPTLPYLHRGSPWGWQGEFENPVSIEKIQEILLPRLSPTAIVYKTGPEKIKTAVSVSGSGAPYPTEMQSLLDKKIDLFICGEAHEWNRELFAEAKIHFIAGGHYATEVFGVKALMEKVKKELPLVEVAWLDVPNEV